MLNVQNVSMIALSKGSGSADNSEVLVKGEHHSLNIWGESTEDDEEEYSDEIFN